MMCHFQRVLNPEVFNKSIDFSKSIHNIFDTDLNIIMNARETLLFHHEETWMKKNGEEEFDVEMGCHNGAEIWGAFRYIPS